MFTDGRLLSDPGPILARVRHRGSPRAFVFAGVQRVPVVSEEVGQALKTLAPGDVQLFPVSVEDVDERFFIVNVVRVVDCIDEAGSTGVQHYAEDDPFPERAGEFRWISGLRILPEKTEGARAFMLKRFKHPIIVAEEVKEALERIGNLGVMFKRVTGNPGA
ncbi:imm11 family protein [Myxococcus faecalis]|uniref:imm11 family protein n=1 Tax=Myxococcus TaxID=32 RepID=UPI0038B32B73